MARAGRDYHAARLCSQGVNELKSGPNWRGLIEDTGVCDNPQESAKHDIGQSQGALVSAGVL